MRQLIRTYTITGLHEITITGASFTKEDVRLIIDETIAITDKRASILVSSTAKNNIVSVISGVITLASTTAALTVGDELTIEIDIDNIAKEALATANKTAIINAINNIDLSTVAKESAATANKEAIIAAINSAEPDLSSVAKETSVKDGNDTTIGMLKDQTNGLAAIKAAIPTVANIQNGLAQESSVKSGNDTAIAVAKAIQDAVGSAPSGSEITTLFAWLTAIYEYLAGQTPEEIPEGLGDRINLLLQFFGLPQALPQYTSMPIAEALADNDDIWEALYGYNTAKVKIHIKVKDADGNTPAEIYTSNVWLRTDKTYGFYYSALYDANGNSVLSQYPATTDPVTELYTYIP